MLPTLPPAHCIEDPLGEPLGDDGTQGGLGLGVVFPRMLITEGLLLRGGRNFRHDEEAADDCARDRVQGTKFLVPGLLGLDQGGDPALGDYVPTFGVAGKSDEGREIAQGEEGSTWCEAGPDADSGSFFGETRAMI